MDKIKVEPLSLAESYRKRKLIEDEELQRIQRRRTQHHSSPLPTAVSDYKRAKEDQSEKYIQDLETKNKTLLAKITDLSHLNKKLSRENTELQSKLKEADNNSSSVENPPVTSSVKEEPKPKIIAPKLEPKRKIVAPKQEVKTNILSTQELINLWEKVSAIPLPQCSCSKSEALIKRRANLRIKKFKAAYKP